MFGMRLFSFIVVLFVISSCMIEEVKKPESRVLVIGSDYLKIEDSILFQNFTESTGIEVFILSKPGKDLYNQIKQDPNNCGIDLLMLASETQLHKFSNANFLQKLNPEDSLELGIPKFTSYKYDYVGFGLDPFVVAVNKESKIIRTYNDLTHNQFINDLSKNEAICLLAPVSRKIPKGKAQEWVESYYAQAVDKKTINDSIREKHPVLTMRSVLLDHQLDSKKDFTQILKSGNAGSFYSLKTFAIVKQAENYVEAKRFISYFSKPLKNSYIAEHLHFVGIFNPEKTFRPYKIPTEELFQYYTLIERWITKLGVE